MDALAEAHAHLRQKKIIEDVPTLAAVRAMIVGMELLLGTPVTVRAVKKSNKKYDLYFDLADDVALTQTVHWDDMIRRTDVRIET